MAQADRVHSTPPTNTSATRRAFINIIAALPIAAAAPAAAARLAGPDPIYAAIEKHKAACFVWNTADDVRSRFNDLSMTDEQRKQCNLLDRALEDARNALDDVAVHLINTAPTTLGGIARAINYIREQMLQDDGIYMPSGLRLSDDTDGEYPVAWIEAFLDTIEHAADELDRAGKAVQS
jgi:hypothetical protein